MFNLWLLKKRHPSALPTSIRLPSKNSLSKVFWTWIYNKKNYRGQSDLRHSDGFRQHGSRQKILVKYAHTNRMLSLIEPAASERGQKGPWQKSWRSDDRCKSGKLVICHSRSMPQLGQRMCSLLFAIGSLLRKTQPSP